MYEMCGAPLMTFQSMVAPCESSGSEHSGEESKESSLSDMVNSFLEQDFDELNDDQGPDDEVQDAKTKTQDETRSNREMKAELMRIVSVEKERDPVKSCMLAEVDEARRALEVDGCINCRQLMTSLRARGLDAGLCKSKWQKQGRVPAGEHEYIDIISDNTRYIVELRLADHFAVARPTRHFASLLETFPEIFVGRVEELKRVVKLMSKAMKASMGDRGMQVPPWKTHEYMKSKWFGSYRRTLKAAGSTKSVSVSQKMVAAVDAESENRYVGFEVLIQSPNVQGCGACRYEVGRKAGRMKDGLLSAAFRVQ